MMSSGGAAIHQTVTGNGATRSFDWPSSLFSALFCIALILSLIADPVVQTFGPSEIMLVAALVGCIGVPSVVLLRKRSMPQISYVDALIIAFLSSLLISVAIGIVSASPMAAFRSGAPYGLLSIALLASAANIGVRWTWVFGAILIVALGQSVYHLALFLQNNDDFQSSLSVLFGRITLIDPRTTIPFFLLLPSLSFVIVLTACRPICRVLAASSLTFGVVCAFLTLTRTHVIVALGSLLVVFCISCIRAVRGERSVVRQWLISSALTISGVSVAAVLLVTVPQLKKLPELFLLRTAIELDSTSLEMLSTQVEAEKVSPTTLQMSAEVKALTQGAPALERLAERFLSIGVPQAAIPRLEELQEVVREAIQCNGADQTRLLLITLAKEVYEKTSDVVLRDAVEVTIMRTVTEMTAGPQKPGGGRVSDEWIPAYAQFQSNSIVKQLFGIGSGVPFVTAGGEPRTYIHNFALYVLVYQGWLGLMIVAALLGSVFFVLASSYLRSGDPVVLSALSTLVVVQGAGVLFAIHKLISGNLLMATVLMVATCGTSWKDKRAPHGHG